MPFLKHKEEIEKFLSEITSHSHCIKNIRPQNGGCINNAYTFSFGSVQYFLKENSAKNFPGMFNKESRGLKELSACKALVVPQPVLCTQIADQQYLILNYLEKTASTKEYYQSLGSGLAQLHQISADSFGLSENNYIGSLVQDNSWCNSWSDFFSLNRLQPLVKWCIDQKLITSSQSNSFDHLYKKLDDIFPKEPASLVHGDLWAGNAMNTSIGPSIYDPASYYGHREMDIAMTRLFGGFDESFYESYQDVFPLQKGLDQRLDICNLYPLLVHVKLFGGSYLQQVLTIIKRF